MSILERVEAFPPDPIFGIGDLAKKDKNPNKVDLTLGVYHNKHLQIETMECIVQAEKKLLEIEKNKAYLPIAGKEDFIEISRKLVFGEDFAKRRANCFMGIQSIGGTNALRMGGDLLSREVTKDLYLSNPTWANHEGIFASAQMKIKRYPYYQSERHEIDFEQMLSVLTRAEEKSVILLHTCCHNPTGCDLDREQWKELSSIFLKRKLIPFFDFAYQGFANGIEEDAWPIRYFAEKGHEIFVAHSFSKFAGLYGERVGSLHVLLRDEESAKRGITVLKQLIRTNFSNPPRHGASLISLVFRDKELRKMWIEELARMRQRIEEMRLELIAAFQLKCGKNKFGFLKNRFGLFSMLGLSNEVVDQLMEKYSIYLTKSGRINLTGLNRENLSHVVDTIVKVTG